MLVKKKNPEWYPKEKTDLKVGETIEITDPQALILAGDVIGLAEDGVTELSGYELYGVMVEDEMSDYQNYLKMKKAEGQQKLLEREAEALKAEIAATPAPVAPEPTPEPTPAPAPIEVTAPAEAPVEVKIEPVVTPKKK